MRVSRLLATCATISLAGCATQVIGTITLSNISSVAGIASTLATGQDLGEHALSLITGKDCRFGEALITEDRDICEEHGSPRTKNDFEGVLIAGKDAEGNVVRGAPTLMSASEGSIEEGNAEPVWERIRARQQKQFAEAERRVAERTRRANEALLAFASSAPSDAITPAATAVAEYKPVISGPVVVLRLAPPTMPTPIAVAAAEEPASAAAAPPAAHVVSVTPLRKPASLQVASAVAVDPPEPAALAEAQTAPADELKADVEVADASLFSGTRLIVPLRKQVRLVSASASAAGAGLLQPVATLAEPAKPYVVRGE